MRYRPRILCFIGLGIAKIVQAQLRFESLVSFNTLPWGKKSNLDISEQERYQTCPVERGPTSL